MKPVFRSITFVVLSIAACAAYGESETELSAVAAPSEVSEDNCERMGSTSRHFGKGFMRARHARMRGARSAYGSDTCRKPPLETLAGAETAGDSGQMRCNPTVRYRRTNRPPFQRARRVCRSDSEMASQANVCESPRVTQR